MTTNPAAPAWWRAVRQARLVPLALPLLLTLAVVPLAQSGGRAAPAPPAAETTVDGPAAPAAGKPALAPAVRVPKPVVQPAGAAPRPAPRREAPRRTVVRSVPGSPPPAAAADDAPPEDDGAVEEAVRCVEQTTVTLGTGSC